MVAVTDTLNAPAEVMGVQINKDKAKFLEIRSKRRDNREGTFKIHISKRKVLESAEVGNFMYLGILIDHKYEEEVEINLRIPKGRRCSGCIKKLEQ